MARRGLCSHCGDPRSPKGNYFAVMTAEAFSASGSAFPTPAATVVKVCENCHHPRPYHRRRSARAAALDALVAELLAEG